jgi:large subunit ribosomal protein L10
MAINKSKKLEIVKKAEDILKGASSVVFVKFNAFKVNDSNAMRKQLRKEGVDYSVIKKTLMKRALLAKGIEGQEPLLEGEVAMAYGKDLLAPAREVYEFQKKFKDVMAIVGGVFDGVYKSKEEMLSIATIPSMKGLQGQFVNLINSPIQGFVMALSAIADKKEGTN